MRFLSLYFMDKRKWFLVSALMACSICQAAYKSGFYVGVNAGGSYDYNKVDECDDTGATMSSGKKLEKGNIDGGFCVGCLHRLNDSQLAVALEHNSDFSFYSKKWETIESTTNGRFSGKLQKLYTASFIGKFGCILKEVWFPYALFGISLSHVKFHCDFDDPAIVGPLDGMATTRQFLVGLTYGFGIEREINERWRLGFEIKNTNYAKKNLTASGETALGTATNKAKLCLNDLYAGIRISYAL